MKILVTGSAGFIGYHLSAKLLSRGDEVIGIDNLNDYYDVNLKKDRLALLTPNKNFHFHHQDVADRASMEKIFTMYQFDRVIHLAAQAGVRYSIENPHTYINSNIVGFINVLENCRHHGVAHLSYASSSSVYGGNTKQPFAESDNVDNPISIYAASKKSNELMAHTYSHLFKIPTTGLRFFTVYGPWGRPDMAMFKFTKGIIDGTPIDIYNNGEMHRDFTYIDDIIEGVIRINDKINHASDDHNNKNSESNSAPYRIYNIGNNSSVKLIDFIKAIEQSVGKKAIMNMMPIQPGDMQSTYADVSALEHDIGYAPKTQIAEGVEKFTIWYQSYYA